MRVAVSFRGICDSYSIDSKDMKTYRASVFNCIDNICNNLFKCNPCVEFHIYGHGWVDDVTTTEQNLRNKFYEIENIEARDFIFEKPKSFCSQYESVIKDYTKTLTEVYKYRPNFDLVFDNIHFRNFFQNQFSYAYSIDKSNQLIQTHEYDAYISLRWDILLPKPVLLNDIKKLEKNAIVNIQPMHSTIFVGDFMCITKHVVFHNFFDFIMSSYKSDYMNLKEWADNCRKQRTQRTGNFNVSCLSNQGLYTYYLFKNGYNIRHEIEATRCKHQVF